MQDICLSTYRDIIQGAYVISFKAYIFFRENRYWI